MHDDIDESARLQLASAGFQHGEGIDEMIQSLEDADEIEHAVGIDRVGEKTGMDIGPDGFSGDGLGLGARFAAMDFPEALGPQLFEKESAAASDFERRPFLQGSRPDAV